VKGGEDEEEAETEQSCLN